jgi:hypothetical protein
MSSSTSKNLPLDEGLREDLLVPAGAGDDATSLCDGGAQEIGLVVALGDAQPDLDPERRLDVRVVEDLLGERGLAHASRPDDGHHHDLSWLVVAQQKTRQPLVSSSIL